MGTRFEVLKEVPLTMEAKDTVKNHFATADEQAEISFKAGIKEAVEWIQSYVQLDILEDENGHPIPYYCFDDIVLQAKLKEWG